MYNEIGQHLNWTRQSLENVPDLFLKKIATLVKMIKIS